MIQVTSRLSRGGRSRRRFRSWRPGLLGGLGLALVAIVIAVAMHMGKAFP